MKGSLLTLIGISNSINVEAKAEHYLNDKVRKLVFTVYNKEQLSTIINQRLWESVKEFNSHLYDAIRSQQQKNLPIFHPFGLELLCRKISSSSGDIRLALDVARQAIGKQIQSIKSINSNSLSNMESTSPYDFIQKYQVPLLIMTQLFGVQLNPQHTSSIIGLPSQQKLLLCLTSLHNTHTKSDICIAQFPSVYSRLASAVQFPAALSPNDLIDNLTLLETTGLLKIRSSESQIRSTKVKKQATFTSALQSNSSINASAVQCNVNLDTIKYCLGNDEFYQMLFDKIDKFKF